MHVGYVSDQMYEALSGVRVEFHRGTTRYAMEESSPRGAIHADIEPGRYRITFAKEGYGSKQVEVTVDEERVHQFRLLADEPLGYAWPMWVQAGGTTELGIHTQEPTQISLWRYGYEKERIRIVDWYDAPGPRPGAQILPDGDITQGGVGWRRPIDKYDRSLEVEAPDESGLYYFHLKGQSGAFFSFPWVVAPDTPAASLAVLASTNTWNAYNGFGGRSNYFNPAGLPAEPVVNPRDDLSFFDPGEMIYAKYEDHEYEPLSFERPRPANSIPRDVEVTDPIEGWAEVNGPPAEWRFLGWLEREDYAYDLYADYQLHDGTLDLSSYDAFVIQTHPEYWSRTMYERVKDWINDDGKLVYLGGNGINCEVEFPDESRMRALNYTANVSDRGDPRDAPEGTYESRFHRRVESEGNLLGIVFTFTGIMKGAPYEVVDSAHWAFQGTGLEDGDTFGERTLQEYANGGASGYEMDKMSRFAPPETKLIAKGLNRDDGGAEMVHYALEDGGESFCVGSITYPSSLLVDETVSTITRNVLDRFLEKGS